MGGEPETMNGVIGEWMRRRQKQMICIILMIALPGLLTAVFLTGCTDSRPKADDPTGPTASSSAAVGLPASSSAETDTAALPDDAFAVTLAVRCDMLLGNMDLLHKEKRELVPEDGVIFPAAEVAAYEGESVFHVLQREMRRARIHLEFVSTPIYNSAYIEGLHNLYEFDAGELSGWMYEVNGSFPSYGSSRYQVAPGDVIVWHYSCDLGRDLGQYGLDGRQRDE